MSKNGKQLGGIGNMLEGDIGDRLDKMVEETQTTGNDNSMYGLNITKPENWTITETSHGGRMEIKLRFDNRAVMIQVDPVPNGFKGEESAKVMIVDVPFEDETTVYGRYFSKTLGKGNLPPAVLIALMIRATNIISVHDAEQFEREHAEEGILREGMSRGLTKHEVHLIRRWCWISTGVPVQRDWLNHAFAAAVLLGKENIFGSHCGEIATLLSAALMGSHLSNERELINPQLIDTMEAVLTLAENDEEVEHIVNTLVRLLRFSLDVKSRKAWSSDLSSRLQTIQKSFDYKKPSKKATDLGRQDTKARFGVITEGLAALVTEPIEEEEEDKPEAKATGYRQESKPDVEVRTEESDSPQTNEEVVSEKPAV